MSQQTTGRAQSALTQSSPDDKSGATFTALNTHHSVHDDPSQNVQLTGHRTFYWIKSADPTDYAKDISDEAVVDEHSVPTHLVTEYLASEIDEEASFKGLPFAMLLVLVFAMLYLKRDQARIVRDIEDGLTFDIEENANFAWSKPYFMGHKNVYDVNSNADFWSWLKLGLLAITLPTEHPISEGQSAIKAIPKEGDEKRIYLSYNRIVGGVRLRQEVAPQGPCPDEKLAEILYPKPCYPNSGISDLNINLEPELYDVETTYANYSPEPKNNVWLLLGSETGVERLNRLERMELDRWLNDKTVRITADFMTYNGHFKTVTWTAVHFFFTRSGHIWKRVAHESVFLDPYESWSLYVLDGLFLLHLSYILLSELIEIFKDAKTLCAGGMLNFFKEYIGFWNFIDWASIIFGYTISFMWLVIVSRSEASKQNLLALNSRERLDADDLSLIPDLEAFIDDFEVLARFVHKYRYIAAAYPVMIALRLFKAFSAQPRLAVVTRTLSSAAVDIIHFGIVFTSIFLTYTVMAVALFGRETSDFCTMSRATGSLFLVLMGDFDLEELREIGRFLTGMWFWTFMILVLLIMLNMLVAIIMDTYTDVKQKISGSDTLWYQGYDMYRRWQGRRAGQRLSIQQIHAKMVKADQDLLIRTEAFMEAVPGIEFKQAHRLMVGAVKYFRESTEDAMSLAAAMSVISNVHSEMVIILEDHGPKQMTPQSKKQTQVLRAGSVVAAKAHHAHMVVDNQLAKQHAAGGVMAHSAGQNATAHMPLGLGPGQAASASSMPKGAGKGNGGNFIEAANGFHPFVSQNPGAGVYHPTQEMYPSGSANLANHMQHAAAGPPSHPWAGGGNPNAAEVAQMAAQRGRGYGSAENGTVLGGARMMREEMVAQLDPQMGYMDPAQQLTEAYPTDILIQAARKRAMQTEGPEDACRTLAATLDVLANLVLEPELCCDTLRRASRKWDLGSPGELRRPRADLPVSTSTAICPCVTEPPPPPPRLQYDNGGYDTRGYDTRGSL